MNHILQKASIVLTCTTLLVGCSSKQSASESTANENVLRVGMECNYAPYNWSTTTKSETSQKISDVDYCDGYDVMMAETLAEKIGREVQIVKLDWDNLILSLQNDQIDAIIAGMTDTEERRQEVDFTTPYYVSTEVMIVKKDSALASATSLQDFSGKKVIGQLNTLYDTIIDQIPNVTHEPGAETFPTAIQALQSGSVDAVTSELPVAKGVVEANPDLTFIEFADGKGFTGADKDASVSIAIRKDDALRDELQKALDSVTVEQREEMMETAVKNQPANNE